MYNDEKENLQSEANNSDNNIMCPPEILKHSAEPIMENPIKLNESKDE